MIIIRLRCGILILVLGLRIYSMAYMVNCVFLTDSDRDALAMVTAGVASVVGGLCHR